jgi:hypothetical protein
VWWEKGDEEEGVVPDCWIVGGELLWPPGPNAEKFRLERRQPTSKWWRFKLKKIKFESGMFD